VLPVVVVEGEQAADNVPVAEGTAPAANGEREGRGGRGRGEGGEQGNAAANEENAEGISQSESADTESTVPSHEGPQAPAAPDLFVAEQEASSAPFAHAAEAIAPAVQQELGFNTAEPAVANVREHAAPQQPEHVEAAPVVAAYMAPAVEPEAVEAPISPVVVEAEPVAAIAPQPVTPPAARAPIDLSAFLADSSLEMVETAPGAAAATPVVQEERERPVRRPRRPAAVAAQDEPLQQVETRS
jgi:hypothetical protein